MLINFSTILFWNKMGRANLKLGFFCLGEFLGIPSQSWGIFSHVTHFLEASLMSVYK